MQVLSETALALDINDEPTLRPEDAISIRHVIVYEDGSSEISDTYLTQPEDEEEPIEKSVTSRVLQYFRGASGRWITASSGKHIFITEAGASTHAITSAAESEKRFFDLMSSVGLKPQEKIPKGKWGISAIMEEIGGIKNLLDLSGARSEERAIFKVQSEIKKWFGFSSFSYWQEAATYEFKLGGFVGKETRDLKFRAAISRAVYNLTQKELIAQNIKYVTLHRGMQFLEEHNAPIEIRSLINSRSNVGLITFDSNPLSSFTTRRHYANIFAADAVDGEYSRSAGVLTVTIPSTDIFSIPKVGFGDASWKEVVLLSRGNHTGVYSFISNLTEPYYNPSLYGKGT